MITIADFTHHFVVILQNMNTDETRFSRGDAMFESVLYQRDKDKRGNERLTVGLNIEFSNHLHVGGQTDAHQFDVIADKIDLLTERNVCLLVII